MEVPVDYTESFDVPVDQLWPLVLIAIGQAAGKSKKPIVDSMSVLLPNTATVTCDAFDSRTNVTVSKLFNGCVVIEGDEQPRYRDPGRFAARLFERVRAASAAHQLT